MRTSVGDVVRALADLVAPAVCVGCAQPCAAALCPRCARIFDDDPCPGPIGGVPGVAVIRAAAPYRGVARAAVLAFKEHGVTALVPALGDALAVAAAGVLVVSGIPSSAPLLLVPAPSSARAQRARGFAPVPLLTSHAARVLVAAGVACEVAPVLRQRQRVRDQAGLGRTARRTNLDGAMALHRDASLHGRVVLLTDDVVTTGSTLAEAARVLTSARARVLGAATVAATPKVGKRGG